LEMFGRNGVASGRISLVGYLPFKEHLELYNRVDIGLDTFPYNGTTTTCEAMWMGVPVITLAGDSHVSRVGASLLTTVGLSELIAQSTENYVNEAIQLANAPDRLREMRAKLRPMMVRSPLMDAADMARSLEEAYRRMWIAGPSPLKGPGNRDTRQVPIRCRSGLEVTDRLSKSETSSQVARIGEDTFIHKI
jgi:protein O-GlcNAc transferase